MSAENLYDFETAMETAASAYLKTLGIMAYTSADDPEFEKMIPRVEVVFQAGAAKQSFHTVDGVQRNASWDGTLSVWILTHADANNRLLHNSYRATVRSAMATLRGAINTYLTYHKAQNVTDVGASSQDYDQEKGAYISCLQFKIDFGIDHAAWAELNT